MENYKIKLKATGPITQLPDSQKLFGALVTAYGRIHGSGKTTKLVHAVFDRKIHLALSNVIPLGYLPLPQDYLVDRLAERIGGERSLKESRARIKERAYIRQEDLRSVLEKPATCENLYPYIKKTERQQLRASIDSVLYGIQGLDTRLYTVPMVQLLEVERGANGREETRPVSDFCFYLQGEEGESLKEWIELLERLKESGESLILGKRASQGLNKYEVTGMEKIRLPKSNRYLNLGMLLPDQVDFNASTVRLFTSQRRPFGMPGGWEQNRSQYFISFIDSGSVIALKDGIRKAGKCVKSPFYDRDIVFGNGFLYPIWLGKGARG